MASLEQELDAFAQFVKQKLELGEGDSLDDLYDQWRECNPAAEDALAVKASLRDMDNGQTGRPFDVFAKEFGERNGIRRHQ